MKTSEDGRVFTVLWNYFTSEFISESQEKQLTW